MTEVITGDNGWRRFQCSILKVQTSKIHGSLVKRSRRRPLTAKTGVRFPYELFCFITAQPEKMLKMPISYGVSAFLIYRKR